MGIVKNNKIYLLLLMAIFLLFSLPFLSHYLFNWDAGQFALGVKSYNIEQHQPHPPGYPIFILFGKILAYFLHDVNLSLILISLFFSLLAVVFLYSLVLEIFAKEYYLAILVSLFLVFNPVFWLYREVALTYTVDAFIGIFLVWTFFKTKKNNNYFYLASLILGLSGGFRPTLIILLFPVYLLNIFSLREKRIKKIIVNILILLITTLTWLVPTVYLTGGLSSYLDITRNLLSASAQTTSILENAPVSATIEQIHTFFSILAMAINVSLIPILYSLYAFFKEKKYKRIKRNLFFWLMIFWIFPASIIYAAVHFGQAGYILIILPAFIILSIWGVNHLRKTTLGRIILITLLLLESSIFLLFNNRVNNPVTFAKTSWFEKKVSRIDPWLFKFNYYLIQENDKKLADLLTSTKREDSETTLIICVRNLFFKAKNGLSVRNDENFRQVMFYLPEYLVLEVAPDRNFYVQGKNYSTANIFHKKINISPDYQKVIIIASEIEKEDLPKNLSFTKKKGYYEASLTDVEKFKFIDFDFKK